MTGGNCRERLRKSPVGRSRGRSTWQVDPSRCVAESGRSATRRRACSVTFPTPGMFRRLKMKFANLFAALVVVASASSANAGLFGCGHGHGCGYGHGCYHAPSCCCPDDCCDTSCCAPSDCCGDCVVDATCGCPSDCCDTSCACPCDNGCDTSCACPDNCCESSCCAPDHCCAPASCCAPRRHHCGGMAGWWRRCCGHRHHGCSYDHSCCAPTCCAPDACCEPTCCAPSCCAPCN